MITIRAEQRKDIAGVRSLISDAFGQSDEAQLVDDLRQNEDIAYSLVAEIADTINGEHLLVGHIVLSNLQAPYRALALAPVSVLSSFQRQGIGSALILAALDCARADGFEIVFVLGNPQYYSKFGFSLGDAEPYECDYSGPHFMAILLGKVLPQPSRLIYPKAFLDLE